MRVAVAGGTGTVGRFVIDALTANGHHSTVLSRGVGVDLVSGKGLSRALEGADAVIDVSNVVTTNRAESVRWFQATTSRLLEATSRAGVAHVVALSIIGLYEVDLGYYFGKRRQEQLLLDPGVPVPTSVLRAAQFHEFAAQMLDRVPGPVALIPAMYSQPIAAREVGTALADLAVGPARGLAPELAGPQPEMVADMARRYLRARGSRRPVIQLRLPGKGGKAAAAGGLLPRTDGPRGGQTFEQWLHSVDGATLR
jgi:uncharacterized protein YbjT (DUF2867 family)